jgi:hypothetical protein
MERWVQQIFPFALEIVRLQVLRLIRFFGCIVIKISLVN